LDGLLSVSLTLDGLLSGHSLTLHDILSGPLILYRIHSTESSDIEWPSFLSADIKLPSLRSSDIT
jgi:hypothetical protein